VQDKSQDDQFPNPACREQPSDENDDAKEPSSHAGDRAPLTAVKRIGPPNGRGCPRDGKTHPSRQNGHKPGEKGRRLALGAMGDIADSTLLIVEEALVMGIGAESGLVQM